MTVPFVLGLLMIGVLVGLAAGWARWRAGRQAVAATEWEALQRRLDASEGERDDLDRRRRAAEEGRGERQDDNRRLRAALERIRDEHARQDAKMAQLRSRLDECQDERRELLARVVELDRALDEIGERQTGSPPGLPPGGVAVPREPPIAPAPGEPEG